MADNFNILDQPTGGASIAPGAGDLDNGSVLFADSDGNISEDPANLFFDATNDRLHIGPRGGSPGTGRVNAYHASATLGLSLDANGRLALPVQGANGGLLIGGDGGTIYRSAPGQLHHDGANGFTLAGVLRVGTNSRVEGGVAGSVLQLAYREGSSNARVDVRTAEFSPASGVAGSYDLGSGSAQWRSLYLGTSLRVGANQVVGAQGAAVADATDAASAITQLNALLARLRAHGLIAT